MAQGGARSEVGRAPFIKRLQAWPQVYAGDFETIGCLLDGVVPMPPDVFGDRLPLTATPRWRDWLEDRTPGQLPVVLESVVPSILRCSG